MAATATSQIRAYNDAALRAMPAWARFVLIVTPGRRCDVCAEASGVFPLEALAPLPHRGCDCPKGCACFYAVRLESVWDPHDAAR